MFKGYVAHKLPGELKPKKAPDAWLHISTEDTQKGAHDECVRHIQTWNTGRKNPTLYWIHVLEVSE